MSLPLKREERYPVTDAQTSIREKISRFDPAALEPFLGELKKTLGSRALAILGYGSTLSSITRSSTSTPDFYVVVRSYWSFHRRWTHALLNSILPPSIYHFTVDGRTAKYNVISLNDLKRETAHPSDCYNVGRLSKHIVVAWAYSAELNETVAQVQLAAMTTIARKVYYLLPRSFMVEELAKESLRISYLADIRVEASDKVDRLFDAQKDFYLGVYSDIAHRVLREEHNLLPNDAGYTKTNLGMGHSWGKMCTQFFIAKSRLRAQMRWPKGILTVEGWVDYVLAKIERTQGIKIELSAKEKKYWYIFAWKHFIRLRKKNLIK
jgi:hypothetical protein